MRKLSTVILGILAFLMAIVLIGYYTGDGIPFWYCAPILVLFSLTYVFSFQIDWYYFRQNPPELEPYLWNALEKEIPFYKKLNSVEKQRFRRRVFFFWFLREWEAKQLKDLPKHIQILIAALAVQVTFGLKEYIYEKYEHIIVYRTEFPSPRFQKLHASESHEDGTMIFAINHLIYSLQNPITSQNLVLYEMGQVFARYNKTATSFIFEIDDIIEKLVETRQYVSIEALEKFMGLTKEELNPFGLATECFFISPNSMQEKMPELYKKMQDIYNQNPLNSSNPVLSPLSSSEIF